MRKALIVAIVMLVPGCLDTTPEEISDVQIQLPIGPIIEGDSAAFSAAGVRPTGAKYLWDFGDGSGSNGADVKHIYVEEGSYEIVLTVVDARGHVGSASESIEILHRNEYPVASLDSTDSDSGGGQSVKINSLVFFDGGSSTDPDGDVLSFEWDFGDGSTGDGIRPNHFYETVGNFTVTLSVRDGGNLSNSAETWVIVSMRTFSVYFTEYTVTIPDLLGYTEEQDATIEEHTYPYNLTNVSYNLQWVESEPGDANNDLMDFPDNFTLHVQTNYILNKTISGTSGDISLNFDALSTLPTNVVMSMESALEVSDYLFQNGYTTAKGQGPWETSIICNEAPSITDLGMNSFLDMDDGNDWYLSVEYHYYSATITEI